MENKLNKAYLFLFFILFNVPLLYNPSVIDVNIFHKVIINFMVVLALIFLFFKPGFSISKNQIIAVLLFILLLFFSSFINKNTVLFFESGFDLSIYYIIVLFVIFRLRNFNLNNVFTIIVAVSAVLSVIGIFQLAGFNILNLKESVKPGSTLGTRIFAAEYMLASIPFVIYFILDSEKNIFTVLSSFGLLLILTYTFLLRSRISYVILFIFIIVLIFFLLHRKKNNQCGFKKYKYILLIITFAASFSLSLLPFSNIEHERKNVTEASDSYFKLRYEPNFGRITFYDASIRLFLEKPVFGIGTNAFPGYYGKYQWDELGDRVVYNISFTHPHNEFLKVLSENGIFALIIFCVIIFYPFIRLFKKLKFEINALPFFLCYTGIMINMMVAFPLSNVSLMILLSFSAGYALIPYDKKEVTKKSYSGKILIFFLFIISVFSLYVNFTRYISEIRYNDAMQLKFENKYKDMIHLLENIDNNFYPLDPNKMPLRYYLGIGYFEEGQYEKSLKCFDEANKLMPYLPTIISNKATTLYAMGNIQETEKTLLDLESKFSHYYEPRINLMALYMNSKRYDEAKILSSRIEADSTSKYAKNHNLFILMQKELNLSR